jgi:uncharacterized protein (TIGR03083 family)
MSQPANAPTPGVVLDVLRASHERLAAVLERLGEDGVTTPSYCDDWTVAQVASHLGSGAEIFAPYVAAGAAGEPAPDGGRNQGIWDAWNAKSPHEQVRDAVAADAAYLDAVEALGDDERAAWQLEVFGMQQDLAGFLRMRLNEHSLHTWDVAVALDPTATLPEDAAALLADNLGLFIGWAGKPSQAQASVEVRTASPERAYHLDLGPSGVSLSPSLDDTDAATLSLPTEALVRLVYGRLDADHTPVSVSADGVDLDLLRTVFPGL